MANLWTDILNLLKAPVAGGLDTMHLFLLVGIVLVAIVAWLMILRYLESVEAEVV
jgi:hypothetical protein